MTQEDNKNNFYSMAGAEYLIYCNTGGVMKTLLSWEAMRSTDREPLILRNRVYSAGRGNDKGWQVKIRPYQPTDPQYMYQTYLRELVDFAVSLGAVAMADGGHENVWRIASPATGYDITSWDNPPLSFATDKEPTNDG